MVDLSTRHAEDRMDIRVRRHEKPGAEPRPEALGFGRYFSPHMFRARYEAGRGFTDGTIAPREPMVLDPAASVLHYGQAVFEGLKAFRGQDGGIRLFRAEVHAQRFV